jgi:hypothetical protein
MFLDTPFTARDSRLFLAQSPDVEVLRIGGVEIKNIFSQIDEHFFAENEIYRIFNYERFAGYESMLRLAGANISSNGAVTLSSSNGNISARLTLRSPNVSHPPQTSFIIQYRMINDVFFIDLRSFTDGEHINSAVTAIERAITNGTRKFIVDLRGNQGGSDIVGQKLLGAMGITPIPRFGIFRRISTLALEQRTGLPSNVQQVEIASIRTSTNPNNVFVSVLTDVWTYSSATMMATWVLDGKLGNVIGSPSRNAPNCFGDMLRFNLPNSNINTAVSYSLFSRPDTNADPNVLWPDIMVDSSLALDRALQFFVSNN